MKVSSSTLQNFEARLVPESDDEEDEDPIERKSNQWSKIPLFYGEFPPVQLGDASKKIMKIEVVLPNYEIGFHFDTNTFLGTLYLHGKLHCRML